MRRRAVDIVVDVGVYVTVDDLHRYLSLDQAFQRATSNGRTEPSNVRVRHDEMREHSRRNTFRAT